MPQQTFNGMEFMAGVQAHPWGSDRMARKVILFAYCLCSFADFNTGKDAWPRVATIKARTRLHHADIAEVKRLLVEAGFMAVSQDKGHHQYALFSASARAVVQPKSPSAAFTDQELAGLSRETLGTIRKRVDAAIAAGTKAPAIRQAAKEFAGTNTPIWDVLKRAKELQDHQNARLRSARHSAAAQRDLEKRRACDTEAIAEREAMTDAERDAERAKRHADNPNLFGETHEQEVADVLQQELGAPGPRKKESSE